MEREFAALISPQLKLYKMDCLQITNAIPAASQYEGRKACTCTPEIVFSASRDSEEKVTANFCIRQVRVSGAQESQMLRPQNFTELGLLDKQGCILIGYAYFHVYTHCLRVLGWQTS